MENNEQPSDVLTLSKIEWTSIESAKARQLLRDEVKWKVKKARIWASDPGF